MLRHDTCTAYWSIMRQLNRKAQMFKDRIEAGVLLAEKLKKYEKNKDAVAIGLPRGGVVVAAV